MPYLTAAGEWSRLDALRTGLLSRCERLAEVSLPHTCLPENFNIGQDSLTNGTTSLGAQCATNLNNKLMLAMFPASRPFFRLAISEKDAQGLMDQTGLTQDLLTEALAQGERDALLGLEMSGSREGLYEATNHLICVGNILMDTRDKDVLAFHPIRDYVVKRDSKGRPLDVILRTKMTVRELDGDLVASLPAGYQDDPEREICWYTWQRRTAKAYEISNWIEDTLLPRKYNSVHTLEDPQLHPLTWRLPIGQDYGVGRVEEYFADFGSNESISEAMNDGAVLASQFRWTMNPAGITRPEDMQNSQNGDVIPGSADDLSLVFANIGQQLQTVMAIGQQYERRLGAGFLVNSAVTRQAERVTAEEIKLQAMELESTLGGTYSRLSRDVQIPISRWLLKKADISIKGTKLRPVVITGLDALSRNADLERLLQFLQNVNNLALIPPQVRAMLQESNIITDIAAGIGISSKRYIASDEEIQQRMQAMQGQVAQGGDPQTANVPQEQA